MLNGKELGKAIAKAIELKIASGAISSKADVARHFNVKPPSIHGWIDKGVISKSRLPELWRYFSDVVGPEHWGLKAWPQTGQQPAVLTNIEQVEIDALRKDVPLISWVQAGDWCETINNIELGDAEDWLWCPVKHSGKTFALRVSGVSMFNPDPYAKHSFKDGDIIYVDPTRQPINNSFVVVRLENENKATFKQLIIEGNHRFLRAINPDWPEKIIEIKNNAVICGVVIYKGSEV